MSQRSAPTLARQRFGGVRALGVGAVARRRPRRWLGPVGRRHASEARSTCSPSTRSTCGPRQAGTRRTPSPRTVPAPGAPSDVPEDPWPSRPVRIRCPPPCLRATTALAFARHSYDQATPGPPPTADDAGGPVGVLEAVPTAEPGAHGPSSTASIRHRRDPDAIGAAVALTQGPSPRCGARARGPSTRWRRGRALAAPRRGALVAATEALTVGARVRAAAGTVLPIYRCAVA